jgi:hypothetical protein
MIRLRFRLPFAVLSVSLLAGASGGCTNRTESFTGSVPPGSGLTCTTIKSAGDVNEARAALGGSTAGTCVALTASEYVGPLDVPAGVALVAQNGSRVRIIGGTAQNAAVSLGEGSQLVAIDVVDSVGVGIAIRAASAQVSGVTVTGSKGAALAVLCKEETTPGCATGSVALTNVVLEKSSLGLWVSGAKVVMRGGSSANMAGTSLSSAAGVIAQDGAQLDFDGVLVEKNQGVGILIDGAKTKATIKSSSISENGERGIWAQRLAGTLEAPALRLEECLISKNKIVGVGSVEVRGIIIVGGKVVETVASPLVTNLESTEQIGDGIGLFSSSDFKLEGTTIQGNARAAGVIDGGNGGNMITGIIIVGGKVDPGPSGLRFVLQNVTGAEVKIPDTDRSVPATPLGVSAPKLTLPPVL